MSAFNCIPQCMTADSKWNSSC